MKKKILAIFGTRPEGIKLFSVIEALRSEDDFVVSVCATAQHRDMLDQVLSVFRVTPDFDLNIMQAGQSPLEVTGRILDKLPRVFEKVTPSLAIVQGDTTTAFAAAWAAFHHGIRVAHVEAGLRTYDKRQPFPEELNRRVIGATADLHFAPTHRSRENLLREGIPAHQIHVTGNTVVDAVLKISHEPIKFSDERLYHLIRPVITVTVHRRENFGLPLLEICTAIRQVVESYTDVTVVFPVHPNPAVRGVVTKQLQHTRIILTEPLDYMAFVHLMCHSTLIISDSGGVQEEAPSLGVPVLVLREVTERPEAIAAGWARLVGTSRHRIIDEVKRCLEGELAVPRGTSNPFGDGKAGLKIAKILKEVL